MVWQGRAALALCLVLVGGVAHAEGPDAPSILKAQQTPVPDAFEAMVSKASKLNMKAPPARGYSFHGFSDEALQPVLEKGVLSGKALGRAAGANANTVWLMEGNPFYGEGLNAVVRTGEALELPGAARGQGLAGQPGVVTVPFEQSPGGVPPTKIVAIVESTGRGYFRVLWAADPTVQAELSAIANAEPIPKVAPQVAPVAELAPCKAPTPPPQPPQARAVIEPAAPGATPEAVGGGAKPGAPAAPEPAAGGAAPPSIRTQIGQQGVGVGVTVVAVAAGKVVEHETGSKGLGAATTVGVGGTGVVIAAKVGGQGLMKTVSGGLLVGAAGNGTRAAIQYAGGSETQGDRGGYAAAGLAGAAIGGPVGAGGAVVIMAAADATSAGIDWYYASREGESLEEKRQLGIIHRNFMAVQNRDLAKEPLTSLDFWKRMAARPGGDIDMRKLLAGGGGPADDWVGKIYQAHAGRAPTPAELSAARANLIAGDHLSMVEADVKAKFAKRP